MRRLVGIGVGPGDPELVTVKAVRELRSADVVLVPVLGPDEVGRAETTVRAHVEATADVRRVVFALNERGGVTHRRATAWDAAADAVVTALTAAGPDEGTDTGDAEMVTDRRQDVYTVAFATIGDPNVYSTFGYLAQSVRDRLDDVYVETVPGITAMQDLAARSRTVLCEGTETLALIPLTAGVDRFRAALRDFDSVVGYKGGRQLPEVLSAVEEAGRLDDAVHGASLGLYGEDIRPAVEVDGPAAYLSTLLIPARRNQRGGRL